jgi:hypothetical protein
MQKIVSNLLVIDTMINQDFSMTIAMYDDCEIIASGFVKITFEHCYREAGAGTGFRQWVFKVTEKIQNMRGFRN